MPTYLLSYTASPGAPQDLPPGDLKPESPSWNGSESVPWAFPYFLLSGLRPWRPCGLGIFPRSVHSFAQTQNPHLRRIFRITPTNRYHLAKIGFEPQSGLSCAPGNSGHKSNPGESRNLSREPPPDGEPQADRVRFFNSLGKRVSCTVMHKAENRRPCRSTAQLKQHTVTYQEMASFRKNLSSVQGQKLRR